jgi:hypothetical protein
MSTPPPPLSPHPPPAAVRPTAEQTSGTLLAWMTNEVSKGTERTYDLGKFAFTVSLGTAVLVTGLVKEPKSLPGAIGLLGAFMALLSALCALAAAWPKTWELGGRVDLADEYRRSINASLVWLRRWAWFYGVTALLALLTIVLR